MNGCASVSVNGFVSVSVNGYVSISVNGCVSISECMNEYVYVNVCISIYK